MRSAGCIVNDIVDEKIDRKVKRTKNRPIASGKLNKIIAWSYVLILCSLALFLMLAGDIGGSPVGPLEGPWGLRALHGSPREPFLNF